ncbi:MAG: hypothetical protein KME16_19005 [Scytolyngbya sp. HA4215-MV1]|jgi:cell division septation protein DedD|nr:hypothetical protein [Scytolyngbya sp. HA4215-MV1]
MMHRVSGLPQPSRIYQPTDFGIRTLAIAPVLGILTIAANLSLVLPAIAQQALPPPPPLQDFNTSRLNPPDGTTGNRDLPLVPVDKVYEAPQNPANSVAPRSTIAYKVIVSGNSPSLLEQIQQVESKAFVTQYQGRSVIQAGAFTNKDSAHWQAEMLKARGIQSEVVGSGSQSVSSPDRGYLIVIPGGQAELPTIRTQVVKLGVNAQNVLEKDSHLGTYVQVGPFSDRQTAEAWNRMLLNAGLANARVYYGR